MSHIKIKHKSLFILSAKASIAYIFKKINLLMDFFKLKKQSEILLKNSVLTMYEAKKYGKNCYAFNHKREVSS